MCTTYLAMRVTAATTHSGLSGYGGGGVESVDLSPEWLICGSLRRGWTSRIDDHLAGMMMMIDWYACVHRRRLAAAVASQQTLAPA